MKLSKPRIAVIGTGHLGTIHTRLLSQRSDCVLSGVFDAHSERAHSVAAQFSAKTFRTLEEALEHSDAVIISAATSVHYEVAVQALKLGKHCFIEKPITSTYDEAKDIVALAKDKKVVVQVGHVERFNPVILAIEPYRVQPMFIEAHRLAQFKPRATDVSVVHDLMIHDIDLVLELVGSPVKKIDANGVAILTDTPDIANARIKFENGAVANLTASRLSQKQMRKMRLFERGAYFSLDFADQTVEIFRLGEENEIGSIPAMMLGNIETGTQPRSIYFEKPPVLPVNAIEQEHSAFISSIMEHAEVVVSAEAAAEALHIAEIITNLIGEL